MCVMSEYVINRFRRDEPEWNEGMWEAFRDADPLAFHRTLPGYVPTPLVNRAGLARQLGVGSIFVKDEAYRLGLNAFKVLGASYAVYRYLQEMWEGLTEQPFGERLALTAKQRERLDWVTFCTATDGNHGRAVAWAAKTVGLPAVIYMPGDSVPARVENIRNEGAQVEVIEGSYDDAVERMKADARANGWTMISDTSWRGYTLIPTYIQAAYSTMFREMEELVHGPEEPGVDVVFVQGGVGALAAGAAWYYGRRYGEVRPKLVCVEPVDAACLLESARSTEGATVAATGKLQSIMAGLNCGRVSHVAWPLIRDTFDAFVAIEDRYAVEAMRRYYYAEDGDPRVVSGESGAAGLAALMAVREDSALAEVRDHLGIGPGARVLLLNTEGATDPAGFERAVGERV